MKRNIFLISLIMAQTLLWAESDTTKIRKMIELSPRSNNPQVKNLSNSLKNKEQAVEYKAKKDDIKNDQSQGSVSYIKDFILHIDNEGETFEKLKINKADILQVLEGYKNQELNLQNLKDVTNIISYMCQVSGYPSTVAYIPPQDLSKAVVQINIAFGTLGKYIIKDEKSLVSSYAIDSKLNKNLQGKIITTKKLEDAIYRINEMYGIQTSATLQSGTEYGQSDIIIELEQDDPASFLLYADNYGTKSTGKYHAGVSASFNNLFKQGDNYNFYLQNSDEQQINFGATYSTFLGNLKISPTISKGSYILAGERYEGLGAYGTSLNLGVNFSYPIFLTHEASSYLIFGIMHKQLQDYYFDGSLGFKKYSVVGNIGTQGIYRGISNNSFSYTFNVFYGNVGDDGGSIELIGNELGYFGKLNLDINNEYYLHEKLTHLFSFSYQKSIGGSVLDSSETISLGGPYGVRAYLEGEGSADNAIKASFGIRYETPLSGFYITPFYDIGYAWYENSENYIDDDYFLDAVGLELLYLKPGEYYIKLDGARAVHQYKYDGERRTRIYLSGGVYF
ncbi:ShlB/FhaC/HecB family hemolysin secretion/activation protein [Campylobacter armoricus]|uniref:ShlB/FhaC/HecB family hemolysin secretion/activation protein n=1 Tax=Campylobacter armoricus TaxID=2505970 RepID=UPI0011160DF0|nr:ShlB/FhaC/HecB family hemolysin secretion/activation protein [Campylobacter armoricus]